MIDDQWAFLQDVAKLIIEAERLGYIVTGGELYRTAEQEQWYVNNGLSDTMNSNHLKRLAIDLNCFKNGQIVIPTDLGKYWESLDLKNRWGGNWVSLKDNDHFERNLP